MTSHDEKSIFPAWFWFFLAFLLSLAVVLLWSRRKQDILAIRRRALRRSHYSEPDLIPIDIRYSVEELTVSQQERQTAVRSQPAVTREQPVDEPDDLKTIEGIGPAIARLLNEHGITTYRQLAGTPVERLDEILREVNLRRLADPQTWPEQAGYAAAGDLEGLKRFQGMLKGGRRIG